MLLGAVEQTSLFAYGYIDNVAAAILHAAEHPATDGKTYNLGEETSRTKRRWATLYSEVAGLPLAIKTLPDALVDGDKASTDAAPRLFLASAAKFATETGFVEPVSLEDQISRTLAFGLAHPEALGPRPDYAREERLIERYEQMLNQLCESEHALRTC